MLSMAKKHNWDVARWRRPKPRRLYGRHAVIAAISGGMLLFGTLPALAATHRDTTRFRVSIQILNACKVNVPADTAQRMRYRTHPSERIALPVAVSIWCTPDAAANIAVVPYTKLEHPGATHAQAALPFQDSEVQGVWPRAYVLQGDNRSYVGTGEDDVAFFRSPPDTLADPTAGPLAVLVAY